jgi:hypothetical protein
LQGNASAATPETYALVVGGRQLVPVGAKESRRIVARLASVVAKNSGKTLIEVNLGCRTYREDGVAILKDFFHPELVKNVKILKLDDIIAGVQPDPALQILRAMCGWFEHCTIKHVDLSYNVLGNHGLEACDAILG